MGQEDPMTQVQDQQRDKPKLSALQQAFCAWPLALVIVGGAIGGLCGGAAWAINTKIMARSVGGPARYALCIATGLVAAGGWYIAAVTLTPPIAPMVAPE